MTNSQEFIRFAVEKKVILFGEHTLKSGRVAPYFFNTGLFNDGQSLDRLSRFYAQAISQSGIQADMLYGPAYKGIPLATAVAVEWSRRTEIDVPWCFNRKEAKDHGEGGIVVGARPRGRVLIVDDVVSAGTSTRESAAIIREAGARPAALAVALDRRERGRGSLSASEEMGRELGLEVVSIIRLEHLVEYLEARGDEPAALRRVVEYRERYGAIAR